MEMRRGRIASLHIRSTVSGLARVIVAIIAVALCASGCGVVGEGKYVKARWVGGQTATVLPEVTPGVEENISFEMDIDQNVSSLRIEIAHESLKEMGISIPDTAVSRQSGKVSSVVRFIVKAKTPARRYVLTLLARDTETRRILARAEIPFAVYPYSIQRLFGCSC
jgi:hypothetical protein